MQARVSLYALHAAAVCVAVKDVRYYLNGTMIEPGPGGRGAIVVRTDGHRLVAIHDTAGHCDAPLILPPLSRKLTECRRIAATDGRDPDTVTLDWDPSGSLATTVTYADGLTAIAARIDGRFVDWRSVVPTSPDYAVPMQREKPAPAWSAFNPAYLGAFGQVAAILRGREKARASGEMIALELHSPENAARVRIVAPERYAAVGVVMPLRNMDYLISESLDWLARDPAPAVAVAS